MATDVVGLVTEDGRRPVERLRRSQLWRVADAYKISYPKDAAAEHMVTILKANSIDVTKPLPGGESLFQQVRVTGPDGKVVGTELYAPEKPHATAGQNIDYEGVLERMQQQNGEQADQLAVRDSTIAEQGAQISELRTMITQMQAQMTPQGEAETTASPAKPAGKGKSAPKAAAKPVDGDSLS